MSEQNKSNLIYFECASMRELYVCLENWQNTNQKHFRSFSIQQDQGGFCCIALIDSDVITPQSIPKTPYEADMERFRRKALRSIGVGVSFDTFAIPYEKVMKIQTRLEKCTTAAHVKAVFAEEF